MKLARKKKSKFTDRLKGFKTFLTLDDKVHFGMYKGMTLEEIGQIDSRYLCFLVESDIVLVSPETKRLIAQLTSDKRGTMLNKEDIEWEELFDGMVFGNDKAFFFGGEETYE